MSDQECKGSGSKREVNQITRETICDSLDGSTRFFRSFHRVYDLAECGVTTHTVYPNFERTGLVDRPGVHRRSVALLHRHGFARDRCLIDERVASGDHSIYWDSRTRLHKNDVANSDFLRLNVLPGFISAHCGGSGQQTDQMADGVTISAKS
jgi:hypothetical protein